jgi:Amiloride-sensitive sodium channel
MNVEAYMTSAKFPKAAVIEQVAAAHKMAPDTVADAVLIDIYFRTLSHTIVEREERTTVIELIGNIGGHIGSALLVSYRDLALLSPRSSR